MSKNENYRSLCDQTNQLKKDKTADKEEINRLKNELNQLKTTTNKTIVEIKSLRDEMARKDKTYRNIREEVNQLKATKAADKVNEFSEQAGQIKSIPPPKSLPPPFPLEPSLAMKEMWESYKDSWSGLSPVLANEWGVYPTMDWRTLRGNVNWNDTWKNIIQGKGYPNYIHAPPLMLPVHLGGWCLHLYIAWKNGLTMSGHIITDHLRYTDAPQQLDVHFKMNLSMKGIRPFVIDKMFTLRKGDSWTSNDILWQISTMVDKNKWALPVLTVEVKR